MPHDNWKDARTRRFVTSDMRHIKKHLLTYLHTVEMYASAALQQWRRYLLACYLVSVS